jgi:hypothetical protein
MRKLATVEPGFIVKKQKDGVITNVELIEVSIVKKKRIRGHCIDCNIGLTGYKAVRCRKCNAIHKRNDPEIDVKQYRRNWSLKKKYGMEPDEFKAYWLACRGKCWICNKKMLMPTKTMGQGLDVVAIDHDHKTKKVRALLCNACNKGLGFFNDDLKLIKNAFIYLGGKL